MKKIISFALWGQDPKYLVGAIRNAELAQTLYENWTCRYYVGASVPRGLQYELEAFENVEVVRRSEWGDWRGMFWRFLPAAETDVDVMISRDTDSRLNEREYAAVKEWLSSDKLFHIMRDHPYHRFPVLGGMWGAKKGAVPTMASLIESFAQENVYGTDYKFFAEAVLPTLPSEMIMVHDEFFGGQPFPTARKEFEYVGEVVDQNEEIVPEHAAALKTFLKQNEIF